MKTINLYFDFEFTSLSPDSQPISLGIVSDMRDLRDYPLMTRPEKPGKKIEFIDQSLSFYAEFSDFDINRCDDWVKENVVSKLKYYGTPKQDRMFIDSSIDEGIIFGSQNTTEIKGALHKWLSQFSDFNIQFVCDCGTFDWYWMLQLLAEWDMRKERVFTEAEHFLKPDHLKHEEELKMLVKANGREIIRVVDKIPQMHVDVKFDKICASIQDNSAYYIVSKIGLPKLPENISPVPQDLNDLIAIKKGISVREAFELNREGFDRDYAIGLICDNSVIECHDKHNALHDAKVIKAIYEKLK